MVQPTTGSIGGTSSAEAGGGNTARTSGSATGTSSSQGHTTLVLVEGSQLANIMSTVKDIATRASQFVRLAMGGKPVWRLYAYQYVNLALTQITAKFEFLTQFLVQTLGSGPVVNNASQLVVLTLARSSPEKRAMRAWTFTQDGHKFYVLRLGETETIVFDTTTRKWSEWKSEDFNTWRVNYGTNWNQDVVAGGVDNNILYDVRADAETDAGRPIVSIVTGGYPTRMRKTLTCDEVMVTASVGYATLPEATMTLRMSDDNGKTWRSAGTLDLTEAGPKTQVSWRSLGLISAPGRIFELTDSGAAKRINSMEMFTREEENG